MADVAVEKETTPVAAVEKEVEDVDAAAPKVAEDEVKEKAVENGTKTVDDAEAVATPAENGTIETPAADDAAAAAPAVADATEESKAADTTATEEKVTATETEHKNGTSTEASESVKRKVTDESPATVEDNETVPEKKAKIAAAAEAETNGEGGKEEVAA